MSKKINPSINCWQNKEWLTEQYFNKKLSFKSIGRLVGKSDANIRYFFNLYNLQARPSAFIHPELTRGSNNARWIGGRVKDARGYVRIFHPESHEYKAKNQKYVLEHILVMEKILGRKLKHPELIHHINGVVNDNRPENLMLMSNTSEHIIYEQSLNSFAKQILFDNIAPHLKDELLSIFNKYLSSNVNER